MSGGFDGDTLVIGLGAVGAATLYQLARRGARVAGIDRHAPPHAWGSSHGETRITRLAPGEGAAYVPLVRRSHEIWRELETVSRRELLTTCGVLVLARADAAGAPQGKQDFFRRTLALARAHGIGHEQLRAAEVQRRHPALRLRGDEQAYFEPEGGFVRPEAAIEVQLQQAQRHGAGLFVDEPVLDIQPSGQRLTIVSERTGPSGSERRIHRADQVVLAVGAWWPGFARHLLPARAADFTVYRQTLHWYDVQAAPAAFQPGALPVFIWLFGDGPEDSFYGFPAIDAGLPRVKVASAQYRAPTTPEAVDRRVAADEAAAFHARCIDGRLPLRAADAVDARACLYTVTADRRFVVDRVPGLPAVHVASACSGHGFKHSAALGQALAERVLGQPATLDLSPFGWADATAASIDAVAPAAARPWP